MQPRPDFQNVAEYAHDRRSLNQITEHYLLERQLAEKLMQAKKEDRRQTYREVYSTLFGALPEHPQHNDNFSDFSYVSRQAHLLRHLMKPDGDLIEIGAGDARLAIEMASHCRTVTAVDVTDSLFKRDRAASNVHFLLTEGTNIDLPNDSVDLVYSNQLMEHLHPDDADDQLREIVRVLRPGGKYFCITPNVTSGPHDISKYFDHTATGFHLKEYSFSSLASAMRRAGFQKTLPLLVRKGRYYAIPLPVAQAFEILFRTTQSAFRLSLRSNSTLCNLLGINMLAVK